MLSPEPLTLNSHSSTQRETWNSPPGLGRSEINRAMFRLYPELGHDLEFFCSRALANSGCASYQQSPSSGDKKATGSFDEAVVVVLVVEAVAAAAELSWIVAVERRRRGRRRTPRPFRWEREHRASKRRKDVVCRKTDALLASPPSGTRSYLDTEREK